MLYLGLWRADAGLPADWSVVEAWMDISGPVRIPSAPLPHSWKRKCPNVPTLPTYSKPPPENFWKTFPARSLPVSPSTPMLPAVLETLLSDLAPLLTTTQRERGSKVLEELTHGVKVPFTCILPPLRSTNSASTITHGDEFTDTLAYWIQQGFVAGPFQAPPMDNFRTNAMIAIEQKSKIRIVMNLSVPEGASFNDAIQDDALEKVCMSTARHVGYTIMDCGKGARLWKWDLTDAYKNLPAAKGDLRAQGFTWLGKYFIETQEPFGSEAAVAAFDRTGHTLADLAIATSKIPRKWVHRILDDLPLVTPARSGLGPIFADHYRRICEAVGTQLAPLCPKKEKSFEDSTTGLILGIFFNTNTLTWYISQEKCDRLLHAMSGPLLGDKVPLAAMQKLLGLLNDFGQMCPFMRAFRQPLVSFLQKLTETDDKPAPLPMQALKDLKIWANVAVAATAGLPIPRRSVHPSASALNFVSDAAGARFAKIQDRFIPFADQDNRGAASISAIEDGPIWFCARLTWPVKLLLQARDTRDHAYGCKTPTLEAVAAILPFLCCPRELAGKEVVLHTDSEAVVYGWESRRVNNDVSASILLRALHLISNYLGCTVFVSHLPRMTTESAVLADHLTRRSTTRRQELAAIGAACQPVIPQPMLDWLEDPSDDWDLANRLLKAVQELVNS